LWIAVFNAEQAGLVDLAAQIGGLHRAAGDQRRLVEETAA
jgi:hypothetical protein